MTEVSSAVVSDRAAPEDRVRVEPTEDGWVFVVADGAGGQGGGAAAAERVVAEVGEALDAWVERLGRLDGEILADSVAGQSTAVVGIVRAGEVRGASVGDSEAWLIEPESHRVLTESQDRQRLGSGTAMPVAFNATTSPGSVLLVASDGLFRGATAEAILERVRSGADAPAVAEVARGRSGRLYDDVGVVLVRV